MRVSGSFQPGGGWRPAGASAAADGRSVAAVVVVVPTSARDDGVGARPEDHRHDDQQRGGAEAPGSQMWVVHRNLSAVDRPRLRFRSVERCHQPARNGCHPRSPAPCPSRPSAGRAGRHPAEWRAGQRHLPGPGHRRGLRAGGPQLPLRPAPRRRGRGRPPSWPSRAGVGARRGATSTCARSAARPSPPTSTCPSTTMSPSSTGPSSRSPTCRPATPSSCRSPWPWPRCGAPRHLHRRERARLQRLPRLPPRVRRRLRGHGQPGHPGRRGGRAAPAHPHPAHRPDQGRDHRPGRGRWVSTTPSPPAATTRRPEGLACGRCDSCLLRAKGFGEAGVADPTRYRHG